MKRHRSHDGPCPMTSAPTASGGPKKKTKRKRKISNRQIGRNQQRRSSLTGGSRPHHGGRLTQDGRKAARHRNNNKEGGGFPNSGGRDPRERPTLIAEDAAPIGVADALPRRAVAVAVLAARMHHALVAVFAFPTASATAKNKQTNKSIKGKMKFKTVKDRG